ncbi:DUF6126 family protein [Streptomyces sp. NPDC048518]|uniref:DUF6126 family protein n=1 Tax=Streptomyces sp. NPDC048518 TaxID=3155029 RepID=UPI0033E9063C
MTEPDMTEPDQQGPLGPEPARDTPARNTMEEKFPRALWVRLIIYVAVGHLFAAFIYLLFELGAKNQ